jgi:hypothetical protein
LKGARSGEVKLESKRFGTSATRVARLPSRLRCQAIDCLGTLLTSDYGYAAPGCLV